MGGLVPELSVRDWRKSRDFYCGLLGFSVLYERVEDGFAFLTLGAAGLMIDQIGVGRDFDLPGAPREVPFGRGMNLQIEVPALDEVLGRLAAAKMPLFLGPEERWYRRDDEELGQRQVVVADPDGYLLRLWEGLGSRRA